MKSELDKKKLIIKFAKKLNSTNLSPLSSGAVVKVPLFVNVGDVLRVDTRTGEYQNRVNK